MNYKFLHKMSMSKVKDEVIRLEEEADKIRGIRIEMEEELQDINTCLEDTHTGETARKKQDEQEVNSTRV